MLFRFTIHAALSSAVAATARTLTNDNLGESVGSVPSLVASGETKKPSAESIAKDTNPFVPQKLKSLDSDVDHGENNNNDNNMDVDRNRNMDPMQELRSSFFHETRPLDSPNHGTLRTARLRNAFVSRGKPKSRDPPTANGTSTASLDLGILESHNKAAAATAASRRLADVCDGNHPVVSPDLNFQGVVKRCLYYKDNCPVNASLPLECWDTSQITSMKYAFYGLPNFNQPLDPWDTSSVTDMSDMFSFAPSFNQPLNSWNTSSAVDMSDMFFGALAFNQPLDAWDTSQVKDMDHMFLDAQVFNQPLDPWETSAVTNMQNMFMFAYSFDQPLDRWNTQAVTSMRNMFWKARSFNHNLDAWLTDSVTDMTFMFYNAASFNQCLSTWAYKNPTALTFNIFNGTSCPDQGPPDTISGPWCQGAYDQCVPATYAAPSPPSSSSSSAAWGDAVPPAGGWAWALLFGSAWMIPNLPSFLV